MFTNSNEERKNPSSLPCAFHPSKNLHSFCVLPDCLLPLCSQCLVIHNEDHRRNQTFPKFEQLNMVIEEVRRKLKKQCGLLEQLSEQYTEDYWEKQTIIEDCRNTLSKIKEKMLKNIERLFQSLQRQLNIKVNQFHDSIHSQYQAMETKLHHLYKVNLRKIKNFDYDDQVTQLNSTRPSIRNMAEISSQGQQQQQKVKFSHPSTKLLKTIIQYYGQKEDEKVERENREIKEEIQKLKKKALSVDCKNGLQEGIHRLGEYIRIQQYEDKEKRYGWGCKSRLE